MIIQAKNSRYDVIRRLNTDSAIETYICRKAEEKEKNTYIVSVFGEGDDIKKAVPFFMDLSGRKETDDFIECFLSKGRLHTVFKYGSHTLLKDKLEAGELLPAERIQAALSLMERIVKQNLPAYLLYEVLDKESLMVSQSYEIYFTYEMKEIERLDKTAVEDITLRLAECMEMIFVTELENNLVPELTEFVQSLKRETYQGYSQIYGRFKEVHEKLLERLKADNLVPETFLIRLWKKLKKLGKYLLRFLYISVFLILAGYLLYTFLSPDAIKGDKVYFNNIGTVSIERNKDEIR